MSVFAGQIPMVLDRITPAAVGILTARLRAKDVEELDARSGPELVPDRAARIYRAMQGATIAHIARPAGAPHQPLALLAIHAAGGEGWASFLATEDWGRIGLSLTRHIRRELIPALLADGMRRVECRALATHSAACRWLNILGAVEECDLPGFGLHDETFVQFAWRKSDVS